MPTKLKRVALYMPPETHQALHELADALNRSAASCTTQLLADLTPQIRDLAKYHRALNEGRRKAAVQALTQTLGAAAAEVIAQANQPKLFSEEEERPAPPVKGRARVARPAQARRAAST